MADLTNIGNYQEQHIYHFNDTFVIDRNTKLYVAEESNEDLSLYDYIVTVNVQLGSLFSDATYQQNGDDMNAVDITLTLDQGIYNDGYLVTKIETSTREACTLGLQASDSFDTRILEILAGKIFGHARARAAIANDTDIVADVQDNLFAFFNNVVQTHAHDIYNQYVMQDLANLSANDVDGPQTFDFTNDVIDFPAWINGTLLDNGSGISLSESLLNGPKFGNSSQLVDGQYNIPILIKFGSTVQ